MLKKSQRVNFKTFFNQNKILIKKIEIYNNLEQIVLIDIYYIYKWLQID